jgi:hypothetical protein
VEDTLNACPRCRAKNASVLLDSDGDPYPCDDCYNEGWENE